MMLAEWNAECAADSPTIVVPWSDPDGLVRYVDLRAEPYDIAEISEAEAYPALQRALRSLNALGSAFLTSKCDVWPLSNDAHAEELAALQFELDLIAEDAGHGLSGYIDILWRDRELFGSAHHQSERLDRLTRRAERLDHPEATLACVLRPAIFAAGDAHLEGYAVTLYVRALGPDAATATARWSAALEAVTALLRSRDLAPARSSATID